MPTLDQFQSQVMRSVRLMAEYQDYARSIGCGIIEPDLIEANEEQGKLLAEWWKAKANGGNLHGREAK